MSLEAFLIGFLYIVLYGILLCILVYAIIFVAAKFEFPIPLQIQKLLWAAVGVILIIMLVSLFLGWRPSLPFRVGAEPVASSSVVALPSATAAHM